MDFAQSFDELLNARLTDYQNLYPGADVAQGSLLFMRAAAEASAEWGLYQYQAYIARQLFADTADTENLEHHAWVRGITRKAGEGDAGLLARYLEDVRRPPAGGNRYDYEKWALSVAGVKKAVCLPLAQGLGTVDLVVVADAELTGSEIPDADLLAAVFGYIESVRPVQYSGFYVLPPTVITQNVTMAVTGAVVDKAQIAADVADYIKSLSVGDDLFTARLVQIAVNNGAETVNVTTPAATVAASATQLIRPGVINVA